MSLRLIVVGDIHGEISLLANLIQGIQPTYEDRFIFLGDYVDRGENTPATVEFLRMLATQVHCIFLKGNHEDMLLDKALGTKKYPAGTWENNGGTKTLIQYPGSQIPWSHVAFLANTLPFYQIGNLLFVHAGFNPAKPLAQQTEQDMMWIREPWLSSGTVPEFEGTIFHGHTIDVGGPVYGHRINLDAGAFQTGILRAAVIQDGGEFQIIECKKSDGSGAEVATETPDGDS